MGKQWPMAFLVVLIALVASVASCELKTPSEPSPDGADGKAEEGDMIPSGDSASSANGPNGLFWQAQCTKDPAIIPGTCEEKCSKDPSLPYCATYVSDQCAGCMAASQEACEKSADCADSGDCAIYGDPPICSPANAEHCAKSAACKSHGFCEYFELCGQHPITNVRMKRPICLQSADWCKANPKLGGHQVKIIGKDGCIMASYCGPANMVDKDCASACLFWGACKAKDGNCLTE